MEVDDLDLQGLKLVKPKIFQDSRGFFLETFQQTQYEKLGLGTFQQDNHSFSQKNCIRGMHFQTYPGQAKLVRVAVGEIYDVVVDIRPNSPSYGQWKAVILDGTSHHQLFIPVGFAHGFCVLSEIAHVLYKVSHPYDAKTEKGFRYNDPSINIKWPTQEPILSERDKDAPLLQDVIIKGVKE